MLQARLTSLRTLAEATDGLAIVDSNDLAGGLKRVVADLTSYYLLGYYSTGKLDGKFHAITVRVKRPAVQVRARRGYLAATPAAALAARVAITAPARADAESVAVTAALAPLDGYTREVPLRAQAAAGWKEGDSPLPFVAVAGELGATREFEDLWRAGATITVDLAPPDGPSVASTRLTIPPSGSRTFRVVLAPGSWLLGNRSHPAAISFASGRDRAMRAQRQRGTRSASPWRPRHRRAEPSGHGVARRPALGSSRRPICGSIIRIRRASPFQPHPASPGRRGFWIAPASRSRCP
jgi:hypothetical protein